MATQHKSISEIDLHETKGASTATAHTLHIANGDGTTTWDKVGPDNLNQTTVKNVNLVALTLVVTAPNGVFTTYLPLPFAADLIGVVGALDALPSSQSPTALTIGVYNSANLLASMTFPTSGALPLVQTPVVSNTNNSFSAGTAIRIVNSTAVTSSGKLVLTFVLRMT